MANLSCRVCRQRPEFAPSPSQPATASRELGDWPRDAFAWSFEGGSAGVAFVAAVLALGPFNSGAEQGGGILLVYRETNQKVWPGAAFCEDDGDHHTMQRLCQSLELSRERISLRGLVVSS